MLRWAASARQPDRQLATALCSAFCRRLISERRNTRLKRSWQDAGDLLENVELTLSTVTAPTARTVAVRLAPCT